MIENAVKQIERDKLKDELSDDTDIDEEEKFEDDLFDYDKDISLTDEDFTAFKDLEEELANEDNDLLTSLMGDDSFGTE